VLNSPTSRMDPALGTRIPTSSIGCPCLAARNLEARGRAGRGLLHGGRFNIALEDRDIRRPWPSGGGHHGQRRDASPGARKLSRSAATIPFRLFEPNESIGLVGLPQSGAGTATGWRIDTSPHRRSDRLAPAVPSTQKWSAANNPTQRPLPPGCGESGKWPEKTSMTTKIQVDQPSRSPAGL